MKIKINKKILLMLSCLVAIMVNSKCYAISDKFKFVIDTIGIPRYNIYGEEINEEIYYKYNVFSYSSPEAMYQYNIGQRFKEVPVYGKWSENERIGEYDYLGRGYSGQPISNVYFPVDGVPEVTPDRWNFIGIYGALESWEDTSKYKYKEQVEYMKNANLLFDTINYNENKCDPYHLVEYNITANSIGLGKVLLNTVPTWKTYGIVTINRINNLGQVRYATLAVSPIAANANVKSNFKNIGSLNMNGDQDELLLNLNFGAKAINLTNYAKPEHIKEIFSTLYINGKEVAKVSGSKTVSVDKNVVYTVSREDFPSPGENKIHIKVVSYLYTEFNVDGLMENVLEKDLSINIDEKIIVPVEDIDVYYQKKVEDDLVVSPLVQTNVTESEKSYGLVEKQRKLAVNLKLKDDLNKLDNIKISVDENEVNSDILYEGDKNYVVGFEMPTTVQNTLYTWEYLRDKYDNYFNIDFNMIGERIKKAADVKVKFESEGKKYTKEFKIDVIDDYQKNINYIFENGVLNAEELGKNYKLEELKNEI